MPRSRACSSAASRSTPPRAGRWGLALAVAVILALGRRFDALGSGLAGGAGLGWADWLLLALVPLAGVALATLTARAAVLRALRQML